MIDIKKDKYKGRLQIYEQRTEQAAGLDSKHTAVQNTEGYKVKTRFSNCSYFERGNLNRGKHCGGIFQIHRAGLNSKYSHCAVQNTAGYKMAKWGFNTSQY